MDKLILFGPQRLHPILRPALDELEIPSPLAAITAGWQEREGEDDELREHVGRQLIDLELYRRTEQVFAADPELAAAHRGRQDRLRALQMIYRYRLDFALAPARNLMHRDSDPALLEPQRESAIEVLRRLDQEHLELAAEIHAEFEQRIEPASRPAVARHRQRVAEILQRAGALLIAGGHVATLLNRMRLFGLRDMIGQLPVLAWSAGAMALGERVVLFHDSPPQGAGNAEVLEAGIGLYSGLLALPHARSRLKLKDPTRVSLFSRRFAPAACVALDEGMSVRFRDGDWVASSDRAGGAVRLTDQGQVVRLEAR